MATLDGMADRTVTINSVSKTFSVTGWRVGWTIAPAGPHERDSQGARLPDGRRGGAAPGRGRGGAAHAGVVLHRPGGDVSRQARAAAWASCSEAGFVCYEPKGAYYIMTDISAFGFPDDVTFARHLVTEIGVASVPGSSFYRDPHAGRQKVRFCFCKKEETLQAADQRLSRLRVRT